MEYDKLSSQISVLYPVTLAFIISYCRGEFNMISFMKDSSTVIATVLTPLIIYLLTNIAWKIYEIARVISQSKNADVYIYDTYIQKRFFEYIKKNTECLSMDYRNQDGNSMVMPTFSELWDSYFMYKDNKIRYFVAKSDAIKVTTSQIHTINDVKEIYIRITGKKEILDVLMTELTNIDRKETRSIYFKHLSNWKNIPLVANNLSDYPLNREEHDRLVSSIKNFQDPRIREFNTKHGIKNRLTFLFEGIPGTGKTSLAFSIAKELNRNVYIYPKSATSINISDISLENTVLVFDDVDFLNIEKRIKTSEEANTLVIELMELLDCNFIDSDNIVIILITNHSDKIEPAVIRRGRIDHTIVFEGLTDSYSYNKIWRIFYNCNLELSSEQEKSLFSHKFPISKIWTDVIYPNKLDQKNAKSALLKAIGF